LLAAQAWARPVGPGCGAAGTAVNSARGIPGVTSWPLALGDVALGRATRRARVLVIPRPHRGLWRSGSRSYRQPLSSTIRTGSPDGRSSGEGGAARTSMARSAAFASSRTPRRRSTTAPRPCRRRRVLRPRRRARKSRRSFRGRSRTVLERDRPANPPDRPIKEQVRRSAYTTRETGWCSGTVSPSQPLPMNGRTIVSLGASGHVRGARSNQARRR